MLLCQREYFAHSIPRLLRQMVCGQKISAALGHLTEMQTNPIDELARNRPQFHGPEDSLTSWASQRDVLEFIASSLTAGSASLETGCGYSTVIFAASGARHTTVTPARLETERVAAYCADQGIATDQLSFVIGFSQNVLPGLIDDGPLDLVYIDGAHGFPYPCIDWVYTEGRLKVGGAMMVDDVRIPTCRILHDYLLAETNWRLERYFRDTAVFRKLAEADRTSDWQGQTFNRSYPDWSFLPRSQRPTSLWKRVSGRLARHFGKS
jgi:predicted O-methyltransferase YrrM